MMQVAFTDTELLLTEEGKLLGKIEFSLSDNTMTILHTYAYESGRRQRENRVTETLGETE